MSRPRRAGYGPTGPATAPAPAASAPWAAAPAGTWSTRSGCSAGRAPGHADAVVSWSGPPDDRLYSSGVGLGPVDKTRRDLVLNFLGCASATRCPVGQVASPVTHVTRSSAPTLQFNSANELVPLAGPREFARALTRKAVPNRLIVLPGMRHAETYGDDAMPATLRWLHRYLD